MRSLKPAGIVKAKDWFDHVANGVSIQNIANLMFREIKIVKVRNSNEIRRLGILNYAEPVALKGILMKDNLKFGIEV